MVLFKKVSWGWGRGRVRDRAAAHADPPGVQFDEGRADFPVDEELGLEDPSRFPATHSVHLVTELSHLRAPRRAGGHHRHHSTDLPEGLGCQDPQPPPAAAVNQTLASHRELLGASGRRLTAQGAGTGDQEGV